MFGLFEAVTMVCFFFTRHLSVIAVSFTVIMVLSCIAGLVRYFMKGFMPELPEAAGMEKSVLISWVVFFVLLALQLLMSLLFMTSDGDDAYFLGHALLADEKDLCFVFEPYTGVYSSADYRHMLAAWPVFIAYVSRINGLHTAINAHTLMPLFLISASYLVYGFIGSHIFEGQKEKLPLFMTALALINIFGNQSVYTAQTFFLTRTWQGKAVLAALVIPAVFLAGLELAKRASGEDKTGSGGTYTFLLFVNLAGAMMSTMSLFLLPMAEAILTGIIAIRYKKPGYFVYMLLTFLPLMYLLAVYMAGEGLEVMARSIFGG
ncbi:MAG: hypothetical protein IKI75_10775 [Lachnospiraceae bacterium]|nr:hypothetical protein [Lachnospiraceae bacterium]